MNQQEAQDRLDATQRSIIGNIVSLQGAMDIVALDIKAGAPRALGKTDIEYRRQLIPEGISVQKELRKENGEKYKDWGLSTREIAAVLGVTHTTIVRDSGTNVPDSEPKALTDGGSQTSGGTNVPDPKLKKELKAKEQELTALQRKLKKVDTEWEDIFKDAEQELDKARKARDQAQKQLAESKDKKAHEEALKSLRERLAKANEQVLHEREARAELERQQLEAIKAEARAAEEQRQRQVYAQAKREQEQRLEQALHPNTNKGRAADKTQKLLTKAFSTNDEERKSLIAKVHNLINQHQLVIWVDGR